MCFGAHQAEKSQQAAVAQQNTMLDQQKAEAAAQLAQQQQIATDRQNKITANNSSIDQAFSQFDDNYYNKAADNVRAYYTPQLDTQFTDAKRASALSLADRGLSDSSAAAREAGKLQTTYDTQLQGIESKAQDAATNAKTDVATRESNLKSLAESGQNLDNFASVISPQIASVQLPSNFDTLGQVFGSLSNDLNTAQQTGVVPVYQQPLNNGLTNNLNANSARIIS